MKFILICKRIYEARLNAVAILFLTVCAFPQIKAQTTLYSETFNSGSSATWSLNTADQASYTGVDQNYWIINNVYASSSGFVNPTVDEPAGITGYPESYYMHVTNGNNQGLGEYNANFYAPTTGNMFAKMNAPIVATGYTNVTLKFWYLCNGGNAHYTGQLYYSINGGTSWIQKGGAYSGVSAAWTQVTVTDPAFNGVADLRFAFKWVQTGAGALTAADPPWAVDDINVTGTSSSSCPLTISSQSSTNPTCNGSNDGTITITATNGSGITYTINSGTAVSNSTGIFTGLGPGTYTVSVSDTCTKTGTNIILTNPAAVPSPTATNNGPLCAGDTLKLFATTVPSATYAWTGPNSFAVQNPVKANAVLTDAGTYSVIATVGSCHSAAATSTVVVNALPATPAANNNGPLCAGDTLKLTASNVAGATYSWTGPNTFTTQNVIKANSVVADGGTYSVVATIGNCHSGTATTSVVVNPSPATPVVGNNGPLCAGDTLKLTASTVAGAIYVWNGPNSYNIQNPVKPGATAADSGVYTVIATIGNCHSAAVTTHLVVSPPPATPVADNNGPVCQGSSLHLTSTTTGSTYTWTGPNNFSVQNPNIANAALTDAGTYTVVAHTGNCSSGPATTTVVVNPLPASPTAANNGPLCVGDTMKLTASTVPGAYTWTGPNSFSVQNPVRLNVAVPDGGVYTVFVTVAGCNSAPATTTLTVSPPPATPVASNNGPLCQGTGLQLSATGTGTTYTWTGPNNFSVQNPTIASVAPGDAGTYTVVAHTGGCSSSQASTTVIVKATPASPVASNNGPVCPGASVQLNASTIAGASYTWTGPNNFSIQNPSIAVSSSADSGTYSVYATVAGCNSVPATTLLIITPVPAAPVASNTGPYCAGGTLQLSASTINGATYSWMGPNTFSVQNPSKANVTPADTGIYTVVATVGGCNSIGATTQVVIVSPPATSVATNNGPVCSGSALQLNATGSPLATYSWTGPNSFNTQNPSITSTVLSDSGIYTVVASFGNCASAPAHTVVVINPTPATPTVSNSGPVCAGDSLHLNASNISGASYAWTGPHNFNQQSPRISNVTPSDSGTYSLVVTVGSCSSGAATTTVIVHSAPAAPTVTATDTIICSNDSAQLCVPATYSTYAWNVGGSTACIYGKHAGHYYVTVTDANGCSVESANHLNLTVRPAPQISITTNGDTLTCNNSGTIQWYFNNGIIPGATSHLYVATQTGLYSAVVTDANTCSAKSTAITVTVLGITAISNDFAFNIYPNPAFDILTVNLGGVTPFAGMQIEIFDIAGRKVHESKIEAALTELNVANLSSGVYMLRMGEVVRKFVKQ